jgi:hypothetical protein
MLSMCLAMSTGWESTLAGARNEPDDVGPLGSGQVYGIVSVEPLSIAECRLLARYMISHSSGEGSAAWRVLDISAIDGMRPDRWLYEGRICVGAGSGNGARKGGGAVTPVAGAILGFVVAMAVVMAGRK